MSFVSYAFVFVASREFEARAVSFRVEVSNQVRAPSFNVLLCSGRVVGDIEASFVFVQTSPHSP